MGYCPDKLRVIHIITAYVLLRLLIKALKEALYQ